MIAWGINALNHGSSLSVIDSNGLRFFKTGPSDTLDSGHIFEALKIGPPDRLFWYERPWVKKARQLYAGQYSRAFDLSVLPSQYLKQTNLHWAPISYTPHHASHAASGYYTSPFDRCAVVVLDAIGEWECATIWLAENNSLKKVWSRSYPNSLGLFYSAFTQLVGLNPVSDEYKLEQMSQKGNWRRYYDYVKSYFEYVLEMNYNFHRGVEHWDHEIDSEQTKYDIAAAVQKVFEEQVSYIMLTAKGLTNSDCLVYMGGCAMNSHTNQLIEPDWKYIWSLPNPGDPSSAIGAVLYHTKQRIKWTGDIARHIKIKV